MFGRNPVTAPLYRGDGVLRIKEIFYTLQGEGPRACQPAVFVRTAGCNLRCHFCDTNFDGGQDITAEAVDAQVRIAHDTCQLVVLTGGEPFAQQVLPLVVALWERGVVTQVETAGTCIPPAFGRHTVESLIKDGALELVCSPKTPHINPDIMWLCRHYKYIVRAGELDSADGLPVYSTQRAGKPQRLYRPQRGDIVYLQPMDEHTVEATQNNIDAAVAACLHHGYRLSMQQHKALNLP